MTTVAYAVRSSYVLSAHSLLEGRVRAVVVPAERALDIDDQLDLLFAEFLLEQKRGAGKRRHDSHSRNPTSPAAVGGGGDAAIAPDAEVMSDGHQLG